MPSQQMSIDNNTIICMIFLAFQVPVEAISQHHNLIDLCVCVCLGNKMPLVLLQP